ncbi:hypothetical protein ACWCPJ_34775 [Streptomyces collinus]
MRLLGHFRLECGAEPVELCRNGQVLLAFVALRRRVSRRVLAGTLWPEVTEEQAPAAACAPPSRGVISRWSGAPGTRS